MKNISFKVMNLKFIKFMVLPELIKFFNKKIL